MISKDLSRSSQKWSFSLVNYCLILKNLSGNDKIKFECLTYGHNELRQEWRRWSIKEMREGNHYECDNDSFLPSILCWQERSPWRSVNPSFSINKPCKQYVFELSCLPKPVRKRHFSRAERIFILVRPETRFFQTRKSANPSVPCNANRIRRALESDVLLRLVL